jgi:hypothetical protein
VLGGYGGQIQYLKADNDYLYAGIYAEDSTDTIVYVLAYNGQGWHMVMQTTVVAAIGGMYPLFITDSVNGRRLYARYDPTTSGRSLAAMSLSPASENPVFSTTRQYAEAGQVDLPYFDGAYEAQQKVALKVRIKVAGATATELVQIAYRIDGSTGSFTSLGSPISATTEQTIYFGSSSEGLAFKSIQFRFTLVRTNAVPATDKLKSPKIEYFAMDFMRLPEVLKGFQVVIDCNEEVRGKTPGEQINNLWTAISSSTLGTFAYKDDAGNTRSYLVKALRPTGSEATAHDDRGTYSLFLAELNNP